MISVLFYSAIALLMLAIVVYLARPRQESRIQGVETRPEEAEASWEDPDLSLAERIFDRTDYLWLKDEVGFAPLADSLLRTRTEMALQWLRAVRKSFDKLVRTPSGVPETHGWVSTLESWNLLRLTLRFHLVLGYAILVVRLLGPYHRLIPSFGWMPSLFAGAPSSHPEYSDISRSS